MLKNFPILSEERINDYITKGYVLVFRYLKAIGEKHPKELLTPEDYEKAMADLEKYPYYDRITKVMPFNEGYNFLKGSNTQYNLRSQLARELKPWASYYNISDEQDPKIKKQFLKSLKC